MTATPDEIRKRKERTRQRRRRAKMRVPGIGPLPTATALLALQEGLCGLCGELIDPLVRWPHTRSLSVDHIRPVARGGKDIPENRQAAHLGCNIRKAGRLRGLPKKKAKKAV